MKFPFITNPQTKQKDPILTVAVVAALGCTLKVLLDGVTFTVFGAPVNLGHVDSMTYATLLSPILGAHGYVAVKGPKIDFKDGGNEDAK